MAGKRGNPNLGKQKVEDTTKTVETVENKEVKEETFEEYVVEEKVEIKKPITQWKPDLNRMICVKNISKGKLIYKSKRQMGYTIEWAKKGDKNYMELGEFINLKNTDRRFVTEPWIKIVEDDEIEILKYANIYQYYSELIGTKSAREILSLGFEDFKSKFDKLPDGFKSTVAEEAAIMIKNGELDSIKIKKYIEEKLNLDLSIFIDNKSNSSSGFITIN